MATVYNVKVTRKMRNGELKVETYGASIGGGHYTPEQLIEHYQKMNMFTDKDIVSVEITDGNKQTLASLADLVQKRDAVVAPKPALQVAPPAVTGAPVVSDGQPAGGGVKA